MRYVFAIKLPATGCKTGIILPARTEIFSSHHSRTNLWSNKPPVQCARWFILHKLKPLECEAGDSPPVNGEVKNTWSLSARITSPVNTLH
jgi:hypothetical protein